MFFATLDVFRDGKRRSFAQAAGGRGAVAVLLLVLVVLAVVVLRMHLLS